VSPTESSQRHSPHTPFGQLLKRLRAAADLTQEELAERSGVSARLISDIERGAIQQSRRDTVRMLADGLGLTTSDRDTFTALARRRTMTGPADGSPGAPLPRTNVPRASGELVGRRREITATTALLLQPDVRLLTLTGPGGVGKTQLALAAADLVLEAFPQGAVFIDLAPINDPRLVLATIARALGVQPRVRSTTIDQVVAAIQGLRVLLVLDNMEHLTVAAADIAQILQRCPELTVLATSRQTLHLRVEREYAVAPLALPDLRGPMPLPELSRIPAVDLFVRRAEAARHTFALTDDNAQSVAEIAVRLDGLPLAIELAAARIRAVSPAELLARLEQRLPLLTGGALDLPARQRTLRATIDWSHALLSPDERRTFRRLAVFAGGFTLPAVELVSTQTHGDTHLPVDALDTLTSLVDKNLIRTIEPADLDRDHDATRYAMLETIREYAAEQLDASDEAERTRARHADWYVQLAEQAEWELIGPDQARWLSRLELEHDNLRAALSWATEQRHAEIAQRLCGALWRFWTAEALFAEGRRWTEAALAVGPTDPTRARARALNAAGIMAELQGDHDAAERDLLGALAIYQILDDRTGIAYSFGNLGVISDAREDYDLAVARYERALEQFRALGDLSHAGFMLGNLGLIAYFQGNHARASALHLEGLDNARMRGDRNSQAITLGNLGLVEIARGNLDQAGVLLREALELRRTLTNHSHLARCLENFALLAAARRERARAARLFAAASALRVEIGAPLPPNDRSFNDDVIGDLRAHLGNVSFAEAWETGVLMSLEEAIDDALLNALAPDPRTRAHPQREASSPS
jgi:predicted ATPase/transcriptional regulator with XRE-family HTH domain